jgi:hypothetical protein
MDLKFEGVTFNATYNATLTEDEFVKAGKENGLFPGDNQEAKLREAHKAIKGAVEPPAEAKAAVPKQK